MRRKLTENECTLTDAVAGAFERFGAMGYIAVAVVPQANGKHELKLMSSLEDIDHIAHVLRGALDIIEHREPDSHAKHECQS